MSDYLTTLAQRQLGQIQTVEPRSRGMFENMPDDREKPDTLEAHSSEPSVAWPGRSGAPRDHSHAIEDDAVSSPAPAPLVVSKVSRVDHAAPPHTTPNLPPREAAEPVGTEQPLQRITRQELIAHTAPQVERPVGAVRSNVALTAAAHPATSDRNSRRDDTHMVQRAWPPEEWLVPPRSFIATREPSQRRTETGEQSEPDVHVTIGRIEVTAVQPPTPQKRPEPTGKKPMSLEEYLSRRQQGRK
jgi:hypothetical protein